MILSAGQIEEKLSAIPGWKNSDNHISKTYNLKNFKAAMELVNQIAAMAENLNHHPDIDIRYNKVTFTLSTHSEGGITEKDFQLAEQIEKAAQAM